jgi:hypothetical protein
MDSGLMLWLFVVSVPASAFGGMLGMASGIFVVPILTMFGHIEIHTAIGASIVSVIACSCGGAAPFLKNGLTNCAARDRPRNSHDNRRFARSVAPRHRAGCISVCSIRRDSISFCAADVRKAA